MTVKINTKDGLIELSDDVIATVVGGSATEILALLEWLVKVQSRTISNRYFAKKTMQKVL